jgi:MFS transporter, DHA1 family, multidrug resistance protein
MKAAPPIWLLVLITFSGTLGIHIFLPAMPQAALALGATTGAMQATVSVYILGLGLGQPIYGPLSDAYGRRPVLLLGLVLYTVGGLWATLASSVDSLYLARLLQALGGCAGIALGRAIVRDTSDPQQTMQRLALMNLIMLFGPALAPLVGQVIMGLSSWRAILAALVALGAINIVLTLKMLRETSQPSGRMDLSTLASNHRQLLQSRRFLGLALGGAAATTSTYAFLAAAPVIFTLQLQRPVEELSLYLGAIIAAAAVGHAAAGRLVRRVPVRRLVLLCSSIGILGSGLLCAEIWGGFFGWQMTLVSVMLYALSAGLVSPVVVGQAISIDPRLTGSASGLYGFSQMMIGALSTWLASLGSDAAASVAIVMLGASIVGQLSLRDALRQHL